MSNDSVTAIKADPTSKLSDDATKKLVDVLNNYYSLKDALVATSADKAITTANSMIASVDSLMKSMEKNDASIVSGMHLYIDTIKTNLGKITSNNSKKTDEIRMYFAKISNPLFAICSNAGLKNAMVYKEHCPMAFDDTGADWLSSYADIKNPYFGDKMLECGEVEDSLK